MKYLFDGLQILFLIVLGINILYVFVFAVASLFRLRIAGIHDSVHRKIAVLIPGYKEDQVIVDVAADALKQDYPQDKFDVIVIADSFKDETIAALKQLPVRLIIVSFENSTKTKALNKAMSQLPDDYDIAVVLDADNIMANDFLSQVNQFFAAQPTIAVQGHRLAKNMNTSFAVLDAISEEIGNQIFRKGQRVLGLSSGIIGSGIAFDYSYFKNLLSQIKAIGGYDKELEMRILKERKKIYYLPDALVYDEKVQNAENFSNQRRRWLSSQFYYVRVAFFDALSSLFRSGNIDYFNKAFQWTLLPRIIIIGLMFTIVPLFVILEWFIFGIFLTPLWLTLFALFLIGFLVAIPRKFYNVQTLKAIRQIPLGVFLMAKNFFKLKGANKKFIHTEHGLIEPK